MLRLRSVVDHSATDDELDQPGGARATLERELNALYPLTESPGVEAGSENIIDVSFDVRTDTPLGADPDSRSSTLRKYHQLLWSKELPSGVSFTLSISRRGTYLYHQSTIGEFYLASDSVIPTFRKEPRLAGVFTEIPVAEREAFLRLSYTIGGMMIFPGNKVDGKMTINGARGCHPRIKDRFDFTVECIRRHYTGASSPLSGVLSRYAAFFALFDSFKGYVDYFLLQDLVSVDYSSVQFFGPFADFSGSPVPKGLGEYLAYRQRAIEFIEARNGRIGAASGQRAMSVSAGDIERVVDHHGPTCQ